MSKDLTQALHDMMQQYEANIVQSPTPQPRGAAPKAKSSAVLPGGSASGGGGLGDLTEQNFAAREFWPNAYTSTDGLFFLPAVKKVVLTDARGNTVNIMLAEPT